MDDPRFRSARPRRRRSLRVTERDRRLLDFIANHRLVLASHAQALLGISRQAANRRLRGLTAAGLLSSERLFHRQPACYRITGDGLAVIGSALPQPRVDLRCYYHDIGVAWAWLAAREGRFGQLGEVLSERRLRSHDGTARGRECPLGVRLTGTGPRGAQRLHYPDLLLKSKDAQRIAVELELSSKGRGRREAILAGYAADPKIDAVLYLVDKAQLARSIRTSAARLGVSRLVHVQRAHWPGQEQSGGATSLAQRGSRASERSR